MTRYILAASIALASLTKGIIAVEPHLRSSNAEQALMARGDESDVGCSGCFEKSQGFKCDGGFDTKKGVGTHCEGGMKRSFDANSSAKDIAADAAKVLSKQVADFIPDKDEFIPMSGALGDLSGWDIEIAEVDGDFTKSMEFGGMLEVGWGCKATYSKTHGGVSKSLECGFKAKSGMGPKPSDIETDLFKIE
mmetsp:Transcript_5918/g.6827  ORF Transcript_5918/g.6827 Transcript_5918/m.6827 type:complete len:192 (+) Transcript_5918:66-641(+)